MTTKGRPQHPSDELLDELDATIMMLGRLMTARHADHHEGIAVTGARMLALKALDEIGCCKAGNLASLLGVKAPAVSSLVDALVRDGFVSREHADSDRRVTLVELTDKGREALHEAEQHRRKHLREYFSVLTEEDIRELTRIHRKIIDSLIEPSPARQSPEKGNQWTE